MPTITAELLADGSWVTGLVDLTRHNSDLLGRQAADRRNAPTVSNTIFDTLRVLDRAALTLNRRIDKSEFCRSQRPTPTDVAHHDAQSARDTLRELGIETNQ